MRITATHYTTLAAPPEGAVVIDVIRAFTVAAYALAGGAARLLLVRGVADALALREMLPDALLAGEVGGRLIAGFHLNNSPSAMAQADVRGRTIIQRTGAGTQGAAAAAAARHLMVASLVNASATVAHIRRLNLDEVTLIPTASGPAGNEIEDEVCAAYLRALLTEPEQADEILAAGLRQLEASGRYGIFGDDTDFPAADVDAILAIDRFPFAMAGTPLTATPFPVVEVKTAPV